MNKKSTLALAVSALLAGHCGVAFADLESVRNFDIPAQPLASALLQFSNQADVQVVGSSNSLTDLATPGVNGRHTGSEALRRLIGGNPVNFEAVTNRSVRILPQTAEGASKRDVQTDRRSDSEKFQRTSLESTANVSSTSAASPTVRLAQGAASPESEQGSAEANNPSVRLEEVIVTGSHIRGAQNLSSPVITIDREAIEASGHSTLEQVIHSLPQNLNNISDAGYNGWNGGVSTYDGYQGSGVNLRGLGGAATLVLLNGRRLSGAGNGSFVDLSLIPLSAVERVEVLTDGASAIYGSDAVGGVVNMILREDFAGAETRVHYGSVTEGSQRDFQVGQMIGQSWESGHALVSYEYFDRTSLAGNERDFVDRDGPFGELILIPAQRRHGALAVIEQRLNERVSLSSDVFFGKRESLSQQGAGAFQLELLTSTKQLGGVLGLAADLSSGWQARLNGLIDQSESEFVQTYSGEEFTTGDEAKLTSVDVTVDGPLMRAPGGHARLAIGGYLRAEDYVHHDPDYPVELDRDLVAAFAELNIPLVSSENRKRGAEHLELSIAARYEDYSDFGSTFNPKVGLAWGPASGLNVRGTWGTSFKAPLLAQLNQGLSYANLYLNNFATPEGTVSGIYLFGNGDSLGPERSHNWTVGFDLTPANLPGLSLSATHFDIAYRDRLKTAFSGGVSPSDALLYPVFDGVVVTRNPDRATIDSVFSRSALTSCSDSETRASCEINDENLNRVVAIVDGRLRNLAGVQMSGLDFSANYRFTNSYGEWGVDISGTRFFRSRQQLIPGGAETDEMNKVWAPVDLRLRNSLSFSRERLSILASLNYVDEYKDSRSLEWAGQRGSVSSWTTVDISAQYDLASLLPSIRLESATLQLSVFNLFDRDPPFIESPLGLHFDGANANPRGRFISAQITTRW